MEGKKINSVGRNNHATLLNRASGKNALKQNIANIRQNFSYPAWFENTMKWTESGQISETEFYNAFDYASSQGAIKLKTTTPKLIPNPNAPAYVRPTFAHDTDQYGYDYLYGERDFKSDEDIWKRFSEDLTRHEEQESRITDAHKHRLSIESKVETGQQSLWDSITELHGKHVDQETRITRNAEMIGSHKHDEPPKCDCAFWDLPCHIGCRAGEAFEGLGKFALIGGVAVVGIWLLKMRLGK